MKKQNLLTLLMVLLAVPFTIFAGMYFFGDRKYYLISLLIILEILIPFFLSFEKGRANSRKLVTLSVLCAICVCSRYVFSFLPQFKPVLALVIIAGVCFGAETGFLTGAITAFVSNFFFGQGPWTPWQMVACGMVGFVAGILFKKGLIKSKRIPLSIFGFFATIVIHGGIANLSSVFMMYPKPTLENVLSVYAAGISFDLIHSISTVFFLLILSETIIEKLERVKIKYGLGM